MATSYVDYVLNIQSQMPYIDHAINMHFQAPDINISTLSLSYEKLQPDNPDS